MTVSTERIQEAVESVVDRTIVRGEQGKFAPGNQGGPGRMPVRKAHEYLDVMLGRCTLERWAEVVDMALADATDKDNVAARRYGREWLSRILFPAIEKVLVASVNVSVDDGGSKEVVKRLLDMLLPTIGAVVESTATEIDKE